MHMEARTYHAHHIHCSPHTTHMQGSMNMSYDSSNLTTPDIKWLGVRPSDLDRFDIPQQCRLPMTEEDLKTGRKLVGWGRAGQGGVSQLYLWTPSARPDTWLGRGGSGGGGANVNAGLVM